MKKSMHQTPNLPGTEPVTDNPNPDNTQGSIPTEPGSGPGTGPRVVENKGTEGGLLFRCSDIDPNCSWEARGRTESELRARIEQHGREKHNFLELSEDLWNKMRRMFRRAA